MADADKNLEILIKTTADTKGADATLRSIDRLKSSARDFELVEKKFSNRNELDATLQLIRRRIDATKEANEEARRGEVLAKQKALFNKLKDEAAQAEKTRFSLTGLRTAISQLGNQVLGLPGLGRSITSPLAVAIIGAIALYVKAKNALKEWDDELNRQEEILGKSNFLSAIKARKAALEETAIAEDNYSFKMANLIDVEEEFQRRIKTEISLLHARNEAANKIAEAEQGLAESQIKHGQHLQEAALQKMLVQGKISIAQYNQAKLTLDADYFAKLTLLEEQHEQEKLARETALRWEEIKQADRALQRAREAQPGLDSSQHGASAAAKELAARVAKVQAEAESGAAAKSEDDKTVKELEAEIKKKYGSERYARGIQTGEFGDKYRLKDYAKADLLKLDAARATQKAHADAVLRGEQELPGDKEDLAQAHNLVSIYQSQTIANANRIHDLEVSLQDLKDKANISDNADTKSGADDSAKRLIEFREHQGGAPFGGKYTIGDEENFERIRSMLMQHQRVSGQDQAFYNEFVNWARTEERRGDVQAALLQRILSLNTTAVDKMQAFARRLDIAERRIQTINNR